jgi:hypothetical protein
VRGGILRRNDGVEHPDLLRAVQRVLLVCAGVRREPAVHRRDMPARVLLPRRRRGIAVPGWQVGGGAELRDYHGYD